MDRLFGKHMLLLERSLDFRTQRHNLLASNVANVETPGYQARDLMFERALGAAMKAHEAGPLTVTHPRHMDGRHAAPLERVEPELIHSGNPVGSLDGNTVDLEREMAKLAENQLSYQVLTRLMSSKFQGLRTAIRESE